MTKRLNKTSGKRDGNKNEKFLGVITYVGRKTEKIHNCVKNYGINVATNKEKQKNRLFYHIKNNGIEEIPIKGIYKIMLRLIQAKPRG